MNFYLELALVLAGYFTLLFILGSVKKDNSLVDIGWGAGYVVSVWYTFLTAETGYMGLLMVFLISVWGLRLSGHILKRKLGRPEDFRYQKWREEWDYFYIRSFFQIYLLQGFLLYIIVYPAVRVILEGSEQLNFWVVIGILVWLKGFLWETIADYQLQKFLENREDKNEIMDSGLWKYSRHPNYFGETLVWWGVFLIALGTTDSMLIIVSPFLITYLILYVSGVPLLEKKYADHSAYQEYARRTNKFFPWFKSQ